MSRYREWEPYKPVAERRLAAEKALAKRAKQGQAASPVVIRGNTIAATFWGKSWCRNLESYSDYANRLPRGRTYLRNGSVVDLQIAPGRITALVSGTRLYTVELAIAPLPASRWAAIRRDCMGAIDSLVELLQGRFSKGVMQRLCEQRSGLFPAPGEIQLACSCPDWATMCKHVAAVLYGVGARLDESPELLFRLRQIDERDLLSEVAADLPLVRPSSTKGRRKVIEDTDLSALFGLELAELEGAAAPRPRSRAARTGGSKKSPGTAKRAAPRARPKTAR